MDWIKELIKDLPLDIISEVIANIVAWWSHTVQNIPEEDLSFSVYVGGSLMVCLLWFFITRIVKLKISTKDSKKKSEDQKKYSGLISFTFWVVIIAVLFTPTVSTGNSADIVPASIAVVYSILMKDTFGAIMHLLTILGVIIIAFLLKIIWQAIWFIINEDAKNKSSNNVSMFFFNFFK